MMYQILCGHVNYALGKTRMQVKNKYRKLGNANIARSYIDTRYRMFHPITKTDHNQNGPLPKRTITKTNY